MRQEMTLQEVREFYGTGDIAQVGKEFEIQDDGRGFATRIPRQFYVFLDGSLIDPAEMLVDRTGWMRREIFKTLEVCSPVSLRYAFGRLVENCKKIFCFQEPTEMAFDSMDIEVEAEWDVRQGVTNTGWIEEVEKNWGKNILHQKIIPEDAYKTRGKVVWILHATESMEKVMGLKADFYLWRRRIIDSSDEVLSRFEVEKDDYREQMRNCLGRLQGTIRWINASEEEEIWPKYDANRDLWERQEYDWQIIDCNDHLEIRGRGGSPGEIVAKFPRCDEVGLGVCREFVAQNT